MRAVLRRSPGRLIVFEGCDGSGKSTQAELLRRWLAACGVPVILTSWNSSATISPAIRRGKRRRELMPLTFSLIHAADLAERLERIIVPHLDAGYVVIADRYAFTGLARDGARGCDDGWTRRLYAFAPLPHMTAYFALDPAAAVKRVTGTRRRLKFYESGLDVAAPGQDRRGSFVRFQRRVAQRYEAMSSEFAFVRIDATLPVSEQQALVQAAASRVISGQEDLAQALATAAVAHERETT